MAIPKVSIVMSTLNRADLIGRAIESIFKQNFKDFEVIIIDDGSTDNTEEIARRYNVRYYKNKKNMGLPYSLNRGIKLAKGEYIARLDDDDYWCHPDKLKMQVEFLDNNRDYLVCGGGMIVIDENDKEKFRYFKKEDDGEIRKSALYINPFSHTTVMFRKGDYFYNNLGYEDWDLWLRLGLLGKFYNFQEYFTCYLMSSKNKSWVNRKKEIKDILKISDKHKKYYPGIFKTYIIFVGELFFSFMPYDIQNNLRSKLSKIKRSL